MAKKVESQETRVKSQETNYEVIDQMFAAVLSQNESEELIKSLRPQAEEAVREMIRERHLPSDYTGTIEYHGIKIVVRRPTSYTWEQNTQLKDATLDYYKSLHAMAEQLNNDLKKRRAEMKGVAKSLELAYPNSESIKHGFTIALLG
jgi:hypothetical protein